MLTHVAPRERVVLVKAAATSVSPPTLTATRTITCMSLRHLHRAGIFVRDAIPVRWMLYITIDWWTRFFSWSRSLIRTAIGQQLDNKIVCVVCATKVLWIIYIQLFLSHLLNIFRGSVRPFTHHHSIPSRYRKSIPRDVSENPSPGMYQEIHPQGCIRKSL